VQVQIKFTASGANSAIGGFVPGDLVRVSAAMAKHLVEEIRVAKYAEAAPAAEPEPQLDKPTRAAKGKK